MFPSSLPFLVLCRLASALAGRAQTAVVRWASGPVELATDDAWVPSAAFGQPVIEVVVAAVSDAGSPGWALAAADDLRSRLSRVMEYTLPLGVGWRLLYRIDPRAGEGPTEIEVAFLDEARLDRAVLG